ncbi:MAG: flagellar motor switch protein FliN [Candidatus Krumholzibacteriota bacterium]|nr:flagellar motor switch protein FliN [Candidatus Krumholzibacteriota bacterium]
MTTQKENEKAGAMNGADASEEASARAAGDAAGEMSEATGAAEGGKGDYPPAQSGSDLIDSEAGAVDESISTVINELEKNNVTTEDALEEFHVADVQRPVNRPARTDDNIDLLMDVNVTLRVELGRTTRSIEEIMSLNPGMVIDLDRKAGDNVDLFLNRKLFARGEVTVVEGNFAVRITQLIGRI